MKVFILLIPIIVLGGLAAANILVWWLALPLAITAFILASCIKEVK